MGGVKLQIVADQSSALPASPVREALQREYEQKQRPQRSPAKEDERGREVENGGEDVLPLGDPGHRLDLDRVEREDRGDDPRPGQAQPTEDQPEQRRLRRQVDGCACL